MTHLYLSDNQLKILPETIGNLTNLTHLYLSDNQLKILPKTIGNLSNLKVLNFKNNKLTTLPQEIELLTKLEELDSRENHLKSIVQFIGDFKSLTEFNNVIIPEKYQGIALKSWPARWLVDTNDVELRKLFIEVVRYKRREYQPKGWRYVEN